MGERLLRDPQLEAPQRVPERRNVLLDEGDQGAGRALARPLQHHPLALFAGLPATCTAGLDAIKLGIWGGGNRWAHPLSPNRNIPTRTMTFLDGAATLATGVLDAWGEHHSQHQRYYCNNA